MAQSRSRKQEKVVKGATVRPELLAVYRRNKFESCNPDIFVFPRLRLKLWSFDLFGLVGQLMPLRKEMTPTKSFLL
jgi:hypothetical protein